MTLAITLLAVASIVGVGAIVVSEPLLGLRAKIKWPIVAGMSVLLAAILAGIGQYENTHFPTEKPKTGARFAIGGSALKKGGSKTTLTIMNRGDIDARVWANGSSIVTTSDHLLSESEEDAWFQKVRSQIPRKGKGIDFLKDQSRTIEIDFNANDAQYDAIVAGTIYLYVFFAMAFTDAITPSNSYWAAEYCVKYFKKLEDSTVCLGHNETKVPG